MKKKKVLMTFVGLYAQKDEDQWFIDSGCTRHMTGGKRKFISLTKRKGEYESFGDDGTARQWENELLL